MKPNPSKYFSGQGVVMVSYYDPSNPSIETPMMTLGNVPDLKLSFSVTKVTHKDSSTGQRQTDASIITENVCTVSATLESWSETNIAMATRGKVIDVAAGTVTDELSRFESIEAGGIWSLDKQKVSSVVITDSSATPVNVSTSFDIDSKFGSATVKAGVDTSSWTYPLKASYAYATAKIVTFFSAPSQMARVRFEGINTARNGEQCMIELYKVELDPTKEMGLISDQFGQFVIEGNAYIDSDRNADENFGLFGRYVSL